MASGATGQLGQQQKLSLAKNFRSVIVLYKMGVNGPVFQTRQNKYRTVAQSLNRWTALQLHPAIAPCNCTLQFAPKLVRFSS